MKSGSFVCMTFMLAIPLPAMAADTLTVYLSGDAWNGNAQATVSINGSQALIPVNQTSSILSVSAVNAFDAVQAFTFTGTFGVNPQVSVSFINDASDGTLANDRNLYLNGFVYNAVMYRNFKKELGYNQTVTYPLAVQPPAPHRAADFLNAIGIDAHLDYLDTSYSDPERVLASLNYLGVNTIRVGVPSAQTLPQMQSLAATGYKFDILMPSVSSDALLSTQLAAVDTIAPAISAIEGPNEVNLTGSFAWDGQWGDAAAALYQKALWNAVRSDAKLGGAAVYELTLGGVGADAYQPLGNLSADATNGNMHIYFVNSTPPASTVQYVIGLANTIALGLPTVFTETNYITAPAIQGSTNNAVQASYDLDLMADASGAGVAAMYFYELLDQKDDPDDTNKELHCGLFNTDGTPKPSATAIHNLYGILSDGGTNATSFNTGYLPYTVDGLPASGDTLLLQRSDATYDLLVWAEPVLWNAANQTQIPVPLRQVQVNLTNPVANVAVFDPLAGISLIAQYNNTTTIPVTISDHPVVLHISPSASTTLPQANGISSTSWYTVVNQNSNNCVDAASSGTNNGTVVDQHTCGYQQFNQEWQLRPTNNGYYTVVNRNASNEVIDVKDWARENGGHTQLWQYGGGTNQEWMPVLLSNGLYKFVGRASGRCLDVLFASTASGVQLQTFDCNGTGAQAYHLVAQP